MGLTGGCMCGAVRYELHSEPWDCGWCHCRTCQLTSGAPAMVFATVQAEDFVWTAGAPRVNWVRSSNFGHRAFCGTCGTPFLMKVDHQPDTVDFSVATLDQPEAITPGFHIFWTSRIAWMNLDDELPRHDKFRPNTWGLEGTEPPA